MVAWNTHPETSGSFSVGVKTFSWVFHTDIFGFLKIIFSFDEG